MFLKKDLVRTAKHKTKLQWFGIFNSCYGFAHVCVCVCVSIFTYILTLCFGRGTFQKYLYVFHMHITLSIFKSVQDPFKWVEHKHCIYVQKKFIMQLAEWIVSCSPQPKFWY
jgi:hypothetical protein